MFHLNNQYPPEYKLAELKAFLCLVHCWKPWNTVDAQQIHSKYFKRLKEPGKT